MCALHRRESGLTLVTVATASTTSATATPSATAKATAAATIITNSEASLNSHFLQSMHSLSCSLLSSGKAERSLSAEHALTVTQYSTKGQPELHFWQHASMSRSALRTDQTEHYFLQHAPTVTQCSRDRPASRSFVVACTHCHAALLTPTSVDNHSLQFAPAMTLCSQSRSASTFNVCSMHGLCAVLNIHIRATSSWAG